MSFGQALRFCPKYPHHPVHFSSPDEIVANSQTEFYALELERADSHPDPTAELQLVRHGIDDIRLFLESDLRFIRQL